MVEGGRQVEVRYFAAAADVSGCGKEVLDLPAGAVVGDVSRVLRDKYGAGMERLLRVAAFLVGEDLTRDAAHPVGSRVDVLPPFAGG